MHSSAQRNGCDAKRGTWRTLLLCSLDHGQRVSVCQVCHVKGESRFGRGLVLLEQPDEELDGIVLHCRRPAGEPGGMLSRVSLIP